MPAALVGSSQFPRARKAVAGIQDLKLVPFSSGPLSSVSCDLAVWTKRRVLCCAVHIDEGIRDEL